MRRRLIVLLAALGVLLPQAALAHGGGVPQVTAAAAGPYKVYVWTEPATPRAGDTLHVTVGVTLPGSGEAETPVTDAAVSVRLTPQNGGAPVALDAESGASAGEVYYEADTTLPAAGTWQVDVHVAGAQGEGDTAFTLTLGSAGANPAWWVLGGLAGILIIAFVAYALVRRAPQPGSAAA